MKKKISLFLAVLLTFSLLGVFASAQTATSKEKTRSIAIVFDNSGSMYLPMGKDEDARRAWCRATYAMEAFAAMMNSNDTMAIYPMHGITVDGNAYSSKNPLQITQATAADIRKIYTPNPVGTPIETISIACEGLEKTQADEKWLVVLTDGSSFYKNGSDLKGKTIGELEKVLTACNAKVNIMFLGIGAQSVVPSNVTGENQFYAQKTQSSTEVLSALTSMCNMIFGRDELPLSGKNVNFDVSMNKIILFIQGSNISNVKLGNETPVSASDMKYATLGGGGQATGEFLVDESLQGVLAIYSDLDAGTYPLSYDGTASSVVCYYEPNVDLSAQLLDATGLPVDPNGELSAGVYMLHYGLVDKYGEEVNSKLLGNTDYSVTCHINGQEETVTSNTAGNIQIDIKPNDVLSADFEVTYLDGYTIKRSSEELGWPSGGLKFAPPPAGLLEAAFSGGRLSYGLTALTEEEPFRVNFFYNGALLAGNQLNNLEALQAQVEGGNVSCKLERDANGYYVALDYPGSAMETDCGTFRLQVTGAYRNEDDLLTNTALASAEFSVVDDSRVLGMRVITEQTYYQQSKLSEGEPIVVKFDFSGQPLTAEELEQIRIDCVCDGFKMIAEADPENSSYLLRMDPDSLPPVGKHEVQVVATGNNEIGREYKLEDEAKFQVGALPLWLRILIPILILLLILFLIYLFLNQKILPKGIELTNTEFIVDGEAIQSKSSVTLDGAGKGKGTIKIYSPKYSPDPLAEQAMFLTVSAISPRMVKSRDRKVRVTMAKLKNASNVSAWKLKSATYVPNPERPGDFIHSVTGTPGFKEIDIGKNSEINIESATDSSSVFFKGKLVFK